MATVLHKDLESTERHPDIIWTVADETARLAITGTTTAQIGGTAWQQDDDTLWKLKSISPNVWFSVGTVSDLTSYALIDGTRAFTGDIDLGSNAITNVGNVDGRDVSADGTALDNHVADTDNPHSTSIVNLGSGTLGQLNTAISDATINPYELDLDATLADGEAVGITDSVAINSSITAMQPLYINASFEFTAADATDDTTMPARCLSLESGTSGTIKALFNGKVRNDSWSWSTGCIYVDITTGDLTQTAPSATGNIIQVVGFAISATVAYFDFNSTIISFVSA